MRGLARRRRLLLVDLLVLRPLLLVSQGYFTSRPAARAPFTSRSGRSLEKIRPVSALLAILLSSLDDSAGPVESRVVPVEAVAAVDTADRRYDRALRTERWHRWKTQLEQMQTHRNLTEFTQLTGGLTDGLTDLIRHVSTTSNLILDPDVDSYYLMGVVVLKLPTLLDELPHVAESTHNRAHVAANRDRVVVARAVIDSAGAGCSARG